MDECSTVVGLAIQELLTDLAMNQEVIFAQEDGIEAFHKQK